jgi:hypothetical protein
MHKLDLTIARLRLLLAEVEGKREALRASRHQYDEQIRRLVRFAVHDDGGVENTLSMMLDVDGRLQEVARQDRYLEMIAAAARRELDSLLLTKLVEEAHAKIEVLRRQQEQPSEGDQSQQAKIVDEIRRLEGIIAEASGAAAKAISGRS